MKPAFTWCSFAPSEVDFRWGIDPKPWALVRLTSEAGTWTLTANGETTEYSDCDEAFQALAGALHEASEQLTACARELRTTKEAKFWGPDVRLADVKERAAVTAHDLADYFDRALA